MRKQVADIVEQYARARVVETMAGRICHLPKSADLDDLVQIVYIAMLDFGDRLVEVEELGQTRFLIARIIKNQYFSETSTFFTTVRKFRQRSQPIEIER